MIKVKQKWSSEVLAEINLTSAKQMEKILQTAFELKNQPLAKFKRVEILQNLIPLMQAKSEFFAKLIADEGGKPIKDARVEVKRAIGGVQLAISALHNLAGVEVPMDLSEAGASRLAFTTLEPIGVVVAVSAFNHPLNLIIHQVIPAIATGCPVIVKPAALTPLCAIELVQLLKDAGLPDDFAQVVLLDRSLAEQLVSDKRVGFFSFIGSAKVGWMLKSKLANGTRCALEHGGVAPIILADYKKIDDFVAGVLKAGFYHAGQVCVSVQRLFAPQNNIDELLEKMKIASQQLVIGDAINETTDIGPLITKKEVDRVEAWVNEAIDEGATLITGGARIADKSYEPTILLNPNPKSKVSTMEVFAPVICVYSYENIKEAINIANSLETSFQSSIFTDNISTAIKSAKKLDASAVMINDYTTFRVDWMPFAGRKSSGYGVGGIGNTMSDMLEHKLIVIKE